MKFLHDDEDQATHLRIYLNVGGVDMYSDVNLSDNVPTLREDNRYFDT